LLPGGFLSDLTVLAEVDEAVAEAKQDGTGGRGANGTISSALAEEHKKDEVIKSAV
jgi:hypothetical protein